MRASPSTPARALQSAAGRYRLPAVWENRPPARRASSPEPTADLYGIVDDTADAALRMRRLEAVLLLAREPLNSRKLAQYAGLADGTEARSFLRRLNQWYDEVGRAFRVEQVAGGFQLLTRPKFSTWIRRQGHVPPEVRLSAPALETLAVVAYRQPVLRADVDAVRGVNCGEILRLLMERDLVRIVGRSEELGRPFLYGTTRRFLEICGLMTLDDLPRANLLRTTGGSNAQAPPLPNSSASGYTTDTQVRHVTKEQEVSVLTMAAVQNDEASAKRLWGAALAQPRAEDDDTFEDEEDLDDDEDDDVDDDEEDDLEDDEEEDDEEDLDEDFDDEWEEVDDEELEEDDDEEDDEDEDWDDDDEEDDDEEEEEKEAGWE